MTTFILIYLAIGCVFGLPLFFSGYAARIRDYAVPYLLCVLTWPWMLSKFRLPSRGE